MKPTDILEIVQEFLYDNRINSYLDFKPGSDLGDFIIVHHPVHKTVVRVFPVVNGEVYWNGTDDDQVATEPGILAVQYRHPERRSFHWLNDPNCLPRTLEFINRAIRHGTCVSCEADHELY